MGDLIVLHRTHAELAQDKADFAKRTDASFDALHGEFDLIKAALDGDADALAKAADPAAVVVAKVEATKIKAGDGSLFLHTGHKLVAWLNDYNKTSAELTALEKRSERFNARFRKV